MEYKEDASGTILGSSKSKEDAICSYYASKKFKKEDNCNDTLKKLNDSTNEKNINYGYGEDYCLGYYCKKRMESGELLNQRMKNIHVELLMMLILMNSLAVLKREIQS